MAKPVLVVDDDRDMCGLLAAGLSDRGFDVDTATDGAQALDRLRDRDYDAVVTDVVLEGSNGLELCRRLHESRPDIPVIIITAYGDVDTAIEAIRAGAYDFIAKPFRMEFMAVALGRAVQNRHLRREVKRLSEAIERPNRIAGLLGESRPMQGVYELIEQVAIGDATVLVTGESGTGKEIVARAIHERSPRHEGRFMAVNCAAMPPALLESELFGHVKGAFTDAKASRQGLFFQADGGTLFLDEIGEMPLPMQPKLLRVLQDRKVRPVGGDHEISFDTRIIAATNRDLETDVEEKRFREDLYYRINVVRIPVPPLRSRGNDILMLAQHFLVDQARHNRKEVTGITPETAQKLLAYDWPGNVRELENTIARAVTLTQYQEITPDDLPEKIRTHTSKQLVISNENPDEMPSLREVEARYIQRVLEGVKGNKSQAARILGMDRRTLYRKVRRYGLDDADARKSS